MGSVPQPVFGQWFGIEKLVRECQNGDNENIQPNEIVNIQSKVSEPGEEHSLLIESDSIEKRIEELKRIQCRHKDHEIDYLEKRAKLKDDYLNGCKVVHEQGWNEFLLSKLKTTEVLADEDWRLIHPVSYRVKKYRVLKRDFLRERARLEAKYQNWFRDLYKERFEIVNGATEVRELNTKGGVPEFWLKAMKNNEVLADYRA
ncbi:PREDICTED: nucleosome assembly protein 1;3-like isoform X2 [Fragaria vesca subsp. vesca]|uniref:nucleosome assembly protein 1;3-like isoform X2 n=1 Tax=Fragaria vesca subsp. vesca TaxID=101020 RepID=UPI0002C31CB4|nr:PREDICTED: nucleosome assembly protein 1;3-like isoform X2 [Fragaria vesca subsp. vesca]XP_011467904.1 PREDICTED: nucleosome assembly protein 1;3-like isoform X2 [Fragaria vesca subsp. vesca]